MTRSDSLSFAGIAFLSLLALTVGTAAAQQKQPNVVFILADNVGYGDLGPYGGGELRGHRHRASTSSPARVCASRSMWSSLAAHHRAPR